MTGGPTPFWGRFSPKTSAPHLRSPCRRLLHPLGDGAQRRAQPFPGGHARSPHPRPPSAAFRHTSSSRPPRSANHSAASRILANGSGGRASRRRRHVGKVRASWRVVQRAPQRRAKAPGGAPKAPEDAPKAPKSPGAARGC